MPATRTPTSRRAALAATGAAAAGLLAACSDGTSPQADRGAAERVRAARAEAALRLRTSAASAALRDRYEAVALRHPAVRDRLAPLREEAAQHATALGGGRPQQTSPPPAPVPDSPSEALRELAATARRVSDAHTAALAGAPPELARLLASVAAAGAVHAYLLTRREGGG
ncbi:hypothetical protein [Streptomyces sp. BPTC-684]|uniref:hypothetical protein n=1 Tax=Streptomyces sp. BPTC-684 TaxID=3043734 RepID=UPI0024B197BE|nr:hypothetical protein [Streptomyces sp. BPTC-684]WHM36225.1 hypothetical protein QIY60_04290 [Streptomyces sp. BPTC-684]